MQAYGSACILEHSACILEHSTCILEHSACILEHSGIFCIHSGTFWLHSGCTHTQSCVFATKNIHPFLNCYVTQYIYCIVVE